MILTRTVSRNKNIDEKGKARNRLSAQDATGISSGRHAV